MKETTYIYDNVIVKIIDPDHDEAERRKRWEEAVIRFYKAAQESKKKGAKANG